MPRGSLASRNRAGKRRGARPAPSPEPSGNEFAKNGSPAPFSIGPSDDKLLGSRDSARRFWTHPSVSRPGFGGSWPGNSGHIPRIYSAWGARDTEKRRYALFVERAGR